MKSFYGKESYELSDIQLLIDNNADESIHLEFKSADSLGLTDKIKSEISKDVSSFANSDGGILIYGIKEVDRKAIDLDFVDGSKFTKEWLEQVITGDIHRNISDLRIFPLRMNGEIDKTIFLIKVPFSYDAPHQASDKRYYKRYNFKSVPMEEYEIRQTFDRNQKSKLRIYSYSISQVEAAKFHLAKLKIEVLIINEGNVIESTFKIIAHISGEKLLNIMWDRFDHVQVSDHETGAIKLSRASNAPLFPGESDFGLAFSIEFSFNDRLKVLADLGIELKLLYPSGEDSMIVERKDLEIELVNNYKETDLKNPPGPEVQNTGR